MKTLLFYLYRFLFLRCHVLRLARWIGESEFTSQWLRTLFAHYHKAQIGIYSYGCFQPRLPQGTTIGKFSSMADGVSIIPGDHKIHAVTTHPFIYNPEVGVVKDFLRQDEPLTIGHDVWIGQNVTILSRVRTIGDGAVLAAGAVVTKPVPPYAVVAGVPATVIKYRFDEETIKKLLQMQWWDWPLERILNNHERFNDIKSFVQAYDKGEIR